MNCLNCGYVKTIKKGKIKTKKSAKKVQRYQCLACRKMFTKRSSSDTYRQKRPDLNNKILSLYIEGMPLRAIARHLNCSYNTVVKKFKELGYQAQEKNLKPRYEKCKYIQFDEMHTFLGSKNNKLFIGLAVSGYGEILAFKVGQDRRNNLETLFIDIASRVNEDTIFYCDKDRSYPYLINKHFPKSDYVDIRSSGPGREDYDFLKHLDFVCALVRNRLGRMTRKSWCFTRKTERLQLNLDMLRQNFNRMFYGTSKKNG